MNFAYDVCKKSQSINEEREKGDEESQVWEFHNREEVFFFPSPSFVWWKGIIVSLCQTANFFISNIFCFGSEEKRN